MASLRDAAVARDQAFDLLTEAVSVRPESAGIVMLPDGTYGLEVLLPRSPAMRPPRVLLGVPVTYSVAVAPTQLLGGVPEWLVRSRKRRHGVGS